MYLVAQIVVAALLSAAIVLHGRRLHRSVSRNLARVDARPRQRNRRPAQ